MRHVRIIRRATPAILALCVASGCTLFSSTTNLQIQPFSESTIAVTSDVRYGVWDVSSIYLRPYAGGPQQLAVQATTEDLRMLVVSIITYSVDVVALGRSDLSPEERARNYGDLFLELASLPIERSWPNYPYSIEELQVLADSARGEGKMLDGLAVTQPVIDALVDVSAELIDAVDNQTALAFQEVLDGIDTDHAAELEFDALAKDAQLRMLHEIQLLQGYRQGNRAALDSLYRISPEYREIVKNDPPAAADLLLVEDRITDKFVKLSNVLEQLRPRLELYYSKLRELEELNNLVATRLRRGRLALLAWSRGHQRLANGITDPAKIDVVGILAGLARRI